jgi:hypothetical protein
MPCEMSHADVCAAAVVNVISVHIHRTIRLTECASLDRRSGQHAGVLGPALSLACGAPGCMLDFTKVAASIPLEAARTQPRMTTCIDNAYAGDAPQAIVWYGLTLTILPISAGGRGGGDGLLRPRGGGVGPHRVPPTIH